MCCNKTKCKAETDICQLDLVLVMTVSTQIHHGDKGQFSFFMMNSFEVKILDIKIDIRGVCFLGNALLREL